MNSEAEDLWKRASRNLRTANTLTESDPDSAASRAYYAAFHAVSALFALEGRTFSSHKSVQAAVHRDLVHAGRWRPELGQAFAALAGLREMGDYGIGVHVTPEQAKAALTKAEAILEAIRRIAPEAFPGDSPDAR